MNVQASKRQEGGNHYLGLGIQPSEFAMVNQWDADAFSVLKYLTRHRSKAGRVDVQKARHFVDLRLEHIEHTMQGRVVISMHDYIAANRISGLDAEALLALEGWVEKRLPETTVVRLVDTLIAEYDLL